MATKTEIAQLWQTLLGAYPYYTKDLTPRQLAEQGELWTVILAEIPISDLGLAAHAHIAGSRFFPALSEIRRAALEMHIPQRESAIVAWGDVMAARDWAWPGRYRELTYTVKDEPGLPPMPELRIKEDLMGEPPFKNPLTAQACRILGGWRAIMASECPAAERARFVEAYEALVARERDEALMLPEVRERQQIGSGAAADLVSRVAGQLGVGR